MVKSESIQVFDSQGEPYKRAFQIFLDHTDQKRNAKRFLQKLVDRLPNRNVFIDAGAGNGEVGRLSQRLHCHDTSGANCPSRTGPRGKGAP